MDDGDDFAGEDLRDELEAAYTSDEELSGQPRDEFGRFANASEDAEAGEAVGDAIDDVGEPAPVEEPAGPSIEMPTSWSKEHGENWGQLPRDIQQLLVDREKEQLADYTRKTQEVAEFRRTYDEMRPALEHVAPMLQQNGISHGDYIGKLITADQMLREHPADFIRQAAQMYGIDLAKVAEGGQQDPIDPQLNQLQQQVQNLQGILHQQTQSQQQQQQQAVYSQIEQFTSATDENGQPKHPHFEAVHGAMAQLIQGGVADGLEDAYEKAVWGNPELRQSILNEQEAARKTALEKEEAERVAQAKKASKSVSGAPANGAGSPNPPAGSLREELSASFDAHT